MYQKFAICPLVNTNIPRPVSSNGVTNDAELNKLYEIAFDGMAPFYRTILGAIRDPAGQDRTGVLLMIDGTYLDMQSSSDVEFNKFMFYAPRHGAVAKFLNITSSSGKIVALLPIATSQSPSSGDGYLVQRYIGLQDDGSSENYLRVLLRGNRRFFVVLGKASIT